jgi:hypothetical protein
MIKKASDTLHQQPINDTYYRVTATLLNSWLRIFDIDKYVFENENDKMCLEDKIAEKREEAYNQFVDLLYRKPVPDNEYMEKGREYEKYVYDGLDDEFSPIVANGAFQVTLTKKVIIDDVPILLYGVLDCLKAGRITDIKRVGRYTPFKYKTSAQHPMYLYLVPNALDFTYLICDDRNHHYYENYERQNCVDIIHIVSDFIKYLKSHELFEIYTTYWKAK